MSINIEDCECRYFISYSGVKLPLKLVSPLTEDELENRNTFFRGYFDAENKLMVCQKVVYGDIELEHRYAYYPDGTLQQADITDVDGELTVMKFGESDA